MITKWSLSFAGVVVKMCILSFATGRNLKMYPIVKTRGSKDVQSCIKIVLKSGFQQLFNFCS